MATPAFEEAIRLVLETRGAEGLQQLQAALLDLGDVSDDTVADTRKLVDQFVELNEAAERASRFEALTNDLAATEQKLNAAEQAAYQLTLAMAGVEKPTREMQRAQRDATAELDKQRAAYAAQWAQLEKLEGELRSAGVNTANLAAVQRELRNQIGSTAGALERQARSVRNEAAAIAQLRQRAEEGDEAFRKFAQSGQVSARALAEYRRRAAEAATETQNLGNAANSLGRLRSLLAPVVGFLGFRSAIEGANNLLEVARAAEDARRSLGNMYGSVKEGNRVYDELEIIAKRNGLAFDATLAAAQKLKAFGLDPLNGSLQALINQNAAVGGSQLDLEGKILALGQAWAKQKLQGEEILQLVERGVPVWDLLQKATGKNVDELQELSSKGELGRNVIKALYEEIGRANAGAASRGLSSISGLVAQLSARWLEFRQRIVDAGVGEYMQRQLQLLLQSTGGLDGLAKRVSAAMISTLEAVKKLASQLAPLGQGLLNITLSLAKHAEAVILIGKVYAGLKLMQAAQGFLGIATAARTATAATAGLAAAETARATSMGALSGKVNGLAAAMARLVPQVALIASVDFTIGSIVKLTDAVGQYNDMLAKTETFHRTQASFAQEQIRLGQELQRLYAANANQQRLSASELIGLTREQAGEYQRSLESAIQYFRGVALEARGAGDSVRAAMASEKSRELVAALEAVGKQLAQIDEAARKSTALRDMAQKAVDKFDELRQAGKSASEAIQNAFDGIDFTSADGITKASHILDQLSARGEAAAAAIQGELGSALAKIADADLPRLRDAAERAFADGVAGANALTQAIDTINLTRLGVDLDVVRTGFSKAGRAAVDQFIAANAEIKALGLSMEQRSQAIGQAFTTALGKVSTSTELKALKQALTDAVSVGNLSYGEFSKAMTAIEGGLSKVTETAKDMGEGVDAGAQQASSALRGLAEAANEAADGADSLAESAEGAAGRFDQLLQGTSALTFSIGETGDGFQEAMQKMWASMQPGDNMLEKFAAILNSLQTQRKEVAALIDDLDKLEARYDPDSRRREQLKSQYGMLSDGEIDALIAKENRVKQLRQQQADAARQAEEAERRANEARLAAMKEKQAAADLAAGLQQGGPDEGVKRIELVVKGDAESPVMTPYYQRVAKEIAPMILREYERSRAVSQVRRGR